MFTKIINAVTDWKFNAALGFVWIVLAVIGTVFQITVSPLVMSLIMVTLAGSYFKDALQTLVDSTN